MQKIKLIRLFAILGLLSLIATGCVYNPPHRTSVSYSVSSGHVEPWGYYYYPDSQVYFHYSSGFYYYPSGSVWVRTRFLPKHFHLNSRGRVRLHIESDKPYLFHRHHCPDPKGRVHTMKPKGVLCAQPPIRYDSPPQHRPIPMAPEETRRKTRPTERHAVEPRRKQEKHEPSHSRERSRQHDSSKGNKSKGQEQRKHKPIPLVPKHEQHKDKHREKNKQYKEESEGTEKKRSKKYKRAEEEKRHGR